MTFEGFDISTELADRSLCWTVVDVHIGDGREVDLGPVELPNGCPEDLALLV
ncbi:MAG TPA: hypothetical protein VK821_02155 [Dehalococcoidia bacterium]|nr:hypothetical protein [Dehalococcoidia bacterium]